MNYPEPIVTLRRLASATPNTGEGSLGHFRDDYCWELEQDYRDAIAQNPTVLGLYHEWMTYDEIASRCVQDAVDAVAAWTAQNAS